MKSIITMLAILFTGILTAQTFTFNCDEPTEPTNEQILESIPGVEVVALNFGPNENENYITINGNQLSFFSFERTLRASRFISEATYSVEEAIANVVFSLNVLDEGNSDATQIEAHLLGIADALYFILSETGSEYPTILGDAEGSLECRLVHAKTQYMNHVTGAYANYFERSVTLLGENGCDP